MQSVFDKLSAAAGWAEAHPLLFTLVIWPFVLGVFTLIFKPRSPEEYAKIAKFSPRLAGLLQFVGALGIDPAKAAGVFWGKIVQGASQPPPPPKGPSILPPAPKPPTTSGMMRVGFVGAAIISLLIAVSGPESIHPADSVAASPVLAAQGCVLLKPVVRSALDAVQLACVEDSPLLDEERIADACNIARDLLPILRKLIAQREAARRAGFVWSPSDAGPSDASIDGAK